MDENINNILALKQQPYIVCWPKKYVQLLCIIDYCVFSPSAATLTHTHTHTVCG